MKKPIIQLSVAATVACLGSILVIAGPAWAVERTCGSATTNWDTVARCPRPDQNRASSFGIGEPGTTDAILSVSMTRDTGNVRAKAIGIKGDGSKDTNCQMTAFPGQNNVRTIAGQCRNSLRHQLGVTFNL